MKIIQNVKERNREYIYIYKGRRETPSSLSLSLSLSLFPPLPIFSLSLATKIFSSRREVRGGKFSSISLLLFSFSLSFLSHTRASLSCCRLSLPAPSRDENCFRREENSSSLPRSPLSLFFLLSFSLPPKFLSLSLSLPFSLSRATEISLARRDSLLSCTHACACVKGRRRNISSSSSTSLFSSSLLSFSLSLPLSSLFLSSCLLMTEITSAARRTHSPLFCLLPPLCFSSFSLFFPPSLLPSPSPSSSSSTSSVLSTSLRGEKREKRYKRGERRERGI